MNDQTPHEAVISDVAADTPGEACAERVAGAERRGQETRAEREAAERRGQETRAEREETRAEREETRAEREETRAEREAAEWRGQETRAEREAAERRGQGTRAELEQTRAELASNDQAILAAKIERLIRERGWNREDLVRHSNLNRQTVRQILDPTINRKLRNATLNACAKALGLTVTELCELPVEQLLPRMHTRRPASSDATLQRLYEEATQPQLLAWIERNPERARELTPEEIDELLSVQGTGGPLSSIGVEHYVELLERKRKLIHQVHAVAGTEYLPLLEQFIGVLFEKVQPYADRK